MTSKDFAKGFEILEHLSILLNDFLWKSCIVTCNVSELTNFSLNILVLLDNLFELINNGTVTGVGSSKGLNFLFNVIVLMMQGGETIKAAWTWSFLSGPTTEVLEQMARDEMRDFMSDIVGTSEQRRWQKRISSFTSRKGVLVNTHILCRRKSENTWMDGKYDIGQRYLIVNMRTHIWQWQWIYIWQWPWIYFWR